MKTIVKTRNEAIQAAKKELREILGVKRLAASMEDKHYGPGVTCDCGETSTVKIIGSAKGKSESVTVGYCKNCC